MDLGVSGLASGFDWRSLVDQLADVERAPQRSLRTDQLKLQQRNNAYSSIQTQLSALRSRMTTLKSTDLFNSRLAAAGDSTVATASASAGAAQGAYTFSFTQLATTAKQTGTSNVGKALSTSSDVSGVVLSTAGFPSAITAGTFTVNGKQVTIATSDTLKDVFDKISTATGSTVTATYDATADKISLTTGTGGSEIVLGSTTDTSNFLQVTRLNNNGSGTVASSSALGSLKTSDALSSANFTTTVSDGGAGAGSFKINGVAISFNASTDSLSDVLKRINDSEAGVVASYDSVNDRLTLSNKTTGDVGIALQDVTGNFLAASGLSGGTLTRGKDLLYTINGGGQLSSKSNTIAESSSGLTGLSVTALKEGGSTTITVSNDTSKIKSAINDFIADYNKLQALIDTNTASSTDAKGKVTAGTLTGDSSANEISSKLRGLVTSEISGLTSTTIKRLESLGITSNGYDNNISLSDSSKLDSALQNNLSAVRDLFTNSSTGLAVKLDDYLDKTIGENGSLVKSRDSLTKQSGSIDTQITDLERLVQSNRSRMITSFVAMEQAQAQINQQLQYLAKRFS